LGIAVNGVDDARLRDSSGLSVIARAAATAGDPADIVASVDGHVLRLAGTTLAFGALNLASANAVTGMLGTANGGTGGATIPAVLDSSVQHYKLLSHAFDVEGP
jgi:hypothetical protein